MQKIWQKGIVGIIMLGIFLLPISAGINIKENKFALTIENNKVFAQFSDNQKAYIEAYKNWKNAIDIQSQTDPSTPAGQIARKQVQETNNIMVQAKNELSEPELEEANKELGLSNQQEEIVKNTKEYEIQNKESTSYGCSPLPGDWPNCIVWIVYTIIFQPMAALARLSARILDFFIYYSISDKAYVHTFVEKGWGAVRDVANIFFIIMLLYIAIKTVLSLNVTDNKRLVGWIIIIALIINFSLFTTKIVIDASNILAKIFYNNIKSVNENNIPLKEGEEAEKSITVGLVKEFNPQTIFTKNNEDAIKENIGSFAVVLFISILLMGYMIYMFFSVALLFVARTISLWISMIFSPMAFISYTVPFNMGKMGHQQWWTELFKTAFLAPLFIFFLYIIILFGNFMELVTYGKADTVVEMNDMQTYMGVIIPFIIIFALLMKAKELAVEYSGEMGKGITNAGKMVGGFALGAATGGAAMLGSGVIGGGASKLMSKYGERLKSSGYTTNEDGSITANKGLGAYFSRATLKTTDATTKATFDIRKTKLGNKLGSVSGMDFQSSSMIGLGSKEGGYKGAGERGFEKLKKESELFKTTMTDPQVVAWSEAEQYKYDAKKNTAMEKAKKEGTNFDEAKFIKENGYKPKNYATAEQLNNARMGAFRDSLGQRDLIGSLAYSLSPKLVDKTNFENSREYKDWEKIKVKRMEEEHKKQGDAFNEKLFNDTYEDVYKNKTGLRGILTAGMLGNSKKPTVESINKGRVGTAKMIIGGGAAIIAGGLTGSLIGATGAGRVVGGSAAVGQGWIQDSAEGRMAASIDKQLAGLGKVEARITEVKDVLASYQDKISKVATNTNTNIANIIKSKEDANGNSLKLRGNDGRIILENIKIDENELTSAISKNTAREVSYKSKIEALNREGVSQTDQRMVNAVKDLETNITEASMLKSIEGIGERIATSQSKLYELGGKKAEVASGGGSAAAPTQK